MAVPSSQAEQGQPAAVLESLSYCPKAGECRDADGDVGASAQHLQHVCPGVCPDTSTGTATLLSLLGPQRATGVGVEPSQGKEGAVGWRKGHPSG